MLTVNELIAVDLLQLQTVAGSAGGGRLISWAHTVDLPDPWRWVSPGDLVMTTGVGLPAEAKAQVRWLEQLVQSNASALVVAPRPDAPLLTQQMLEVADRLLFPVLQASFELEFVKLSHYVIESVLRAQRERFNASERLFQTYAEALRQETDLAGRLAILAHTLGLDLAIEDTVSGATIVETRPAENQDPASVERIPIAGRTHANLVIRRKAKWAQDDQILVRSLVGLLAVELERQMIQRDLQRNEGADLMHSLLDNDTEHTLARPMLARQGLDGTLVSLAIRADTGGPWPVDEIHQSPALHHSSFLLMSDKGLLFAICNDDATFIETLRRNLGDGTLVGVSGAIAAATGFRESIRQSSLALAQARETGLSTLRYGEVDTGLVIVPRTTAEARALVGRYLGPLIEYDRTQGTALLVSLTTFLDNDGSWKATALDLGIHRQTLVYRMKLIEQLTGICPTTTSGTARLWIAIQAGRNTQLLADR